MAHENIKHQSWAILFGDAAVAEAVDRDGWNDYVITARGNTLTQTLNGVPTMMLIDNEKGKAADCGVLALQLHAGPPMTVRFRSIRLKRFAPEAGESLFDGQTLTGWKRHDALPGHGVAGKWYVEDGAIVGADATLLVTVGAFALTGREVDLPVVAAAARVTPR